MILLFVHFLSENANWIFSGVGVLLVSYLVDHFLLKPKRESSTTIVNVNSPIQDSTFSHPSGEEVRPVDDARLKLHTFILFVDDNRDFNVVGILRDQGWKHTKLIKDIKNLDNDDVRQSHIIFVDINGVGTKLFPEKQGLGLAAALKDRFPEKKIVVYSAQTNGPRFDRELREVDDCLPKDAEPYQFITIVDRLAKEVNEETSCR